MLFDLTPEDNGSKDVGTASTVSEHVRSVESDVPDDKLEEIYLAGARCSRLLRGVAASLRILSPMLLADATQVIADFVAGCDIIPTNPNVKTLMSCMGEQVVSIRNVSIYYYQRSGVFVIYRIDFEGPDDDDDGGASLPPVLPFDLANVGGWSVAISHNDYNIAAVQENLSRLGRLYVVAMIAALLGSQVAFLAISRLADLASRALTGSRRTDPWLLETNLEGHALRTTLSSYRFDRSILELPSVLECNYVDRESLLPQDEILLTSTQELLEGRAEEIRAELRMERSQNGLWIFFLDLLHGNSCKNLSASLKLAAIDDLPTSIYMDHRPEIGRLIVRLRR